VSSASSNQFIAERRVTVREADSILARHLHFKVLVNRLAIVVAQALTRRMAESRIVVPPATSTKSSSRKPL
jgi:hypothetical protein